VAAVKLTTTEAAQDQATGWELTR